jgi:DNA-binding transcriptional MocR family regulator
MALDEMSTVGRGASSRGQGVGASGQLEAPQPRPGSTLAIARIVDLIRSNQKRRICYTDIVDNLVELIDRGVLVPGERLPPQRLLAYKLNVAVGTVSRAYTEAERRGLAVGEVGRGTFIAGFATAKAKPSTDAAPEIIDFTPNRLPVDGYVGEFCNTLAYIAKRPNVAAMLDYPRHSGDTRFRGIAASWIEKIGLSASPDSLVVCNGVQHGLSVILGALSKPGDMIVAEELNYPGIRLLERTYHLRLRGVAIDECGMIPEALEEICNKERPKFIFCQPTVHNPTTAVMPVERRVQIARIVERHDVTLIEDDIYAFMPEKPLAPISSLIRERSYYVTGTSKTIGAGIRVGYIVAPASTVHDLHDMVHATTWIPAPFMVEIASTWMLDGTAKRIIESHRKSAQQRQKIADKILADFSFRSQSTSFHIWLSLPKHWRHDEFAIECRSENIAVNASQSFVVGDAVPPNAVRICLGGFRSIGRLEQGLEALRAVLGRRPRHDTLMV